MTGSLGGAVERGDVDELVRVVDGLCASRDWAGLVELRDRCMRAVERGLQLWPAAHLAEYRLALDAPGSFAASVLVEGAGRFAPGPLAEVAAATHTWSELEPHVTPGPVAALCAHERVVRGEDLTGEAVVPPVLDLPLRLEPWEPKYALAEYRDEGATFPAPALPEPSDEVIVPMVVDAVDHHATCTSLEDLARAWSTESEARVRAVAVQGEMADALGGLGARDARVCELGPSDALAWMGWAAASGGAHGRRRGAAPGRMDAWIAAAALAGLGDEWPIASEALGSAIGTRRWWRWDALDEPGSGWSIHLAIEDPATGRAWALAATDRG